MGNKAMHLKRRGAFPGTYEYGCEVDEGWYVCTQDVTLTRNVVATQITTENNNVEISMLKNQLVVVHSKKDSNNHTSVYLFIPFQNPQNAFTIWEDFGPQYGDPPLKLTIGRVSEGYPNRYNLVPWETAPMEFQSACKNEVDSVISMVRPTYEKGVLN